MTFFFTVIMKRKTLVCQFASPLDVDVHNTPQVWSCFEKQKAHQLIMLFFMFLKKTGHLT